MPNLRHVGFILQRCGNHKSMKKLLTLLSSVAFVFLIASQAEASAITVKSGDSMWKIAKRYNVSFVEVLRINIKHHINPNLIHVGDIVYIPDGSNGTNTGQSSANDNIAHGNETALQTEKPAQAEAVLNLVNAERKKQGLNALTLSTKLTSIATTKAQDMAQNNYFSHTSPTYGSPFEMLQRFGVSYRTAGENIAAGQRTPEEVMQSWMNSSGHRANILNAKYTELGVGYYKGGSYGSYWVQLFTGK